MSGLSRATEGAERLLRVDCDVDDVREACRFAAIDPLRGRGYPWGYRLDLGEGRRGMQMHAVPTSIDPSSTRKKLLTRFDDSHLRSASAISVAFEARLERVGFIWISDGSSVASIAPPHSGVPLIGAAVGALLALEAGWWGLREVLQRPVAQTLRQAAD